MDDSEQQFVGTVKSRLARRREPLRRQLSQPGFAPSLVLAARTGLTSPVMAAVSASPETRVSEQSDRLAAHWAFIAALPSTIATPVAAELTRGHMARAVRAGVALFAIGMALTAAVAGTSTTADDPTPGPAQAERPKAKLSPIHA